MSIIYIIYTPYILHLINGYIIKSPSDFWGRLGTVQWMPSRQLRTQLGNPIKIMGIHGMIGMIGLKIRLIQKSDILELGSLEYLNTWILTVIKWLFFQNPILKKSH